ncbi:MAG: histidine phosphatase family protein, partial [Chloroflexota bacterium]
AAQALEEAMERHPDEDVVLVSHEVVCRVLLCHAMGLDNSHFWSLGQSVCAINVIEQGRDSLRVALLNDTCHLIA